LSAFQGRSAHMIAPNLLPMALPANADNVGARQHG
jgi:hypothetical protein